MQMQMQELLLCPEVSKSPTQDTGFRRRRRCCGDGREGDVFVVGKLMTERAARSWSVVGMDPQLSTRERESVCVVLYFSPSPALELSW